MFLLRSINGISTMRNSFKIYKYPNNFTSLQYSNLNLYKYCTQRIENSDNIEEDYYNSDYNTEEEESDNQIEEINRPKFDDGYLERDIYPRRTIYNLLKRKKPTSTRHINCILLKTIPGLGEEGDHIEVKKGHFRNYLYPKQYATYDNPRNRMKIWKEKKHTSSRLSRIY
eukprot:TRINITY_DN4975_c0_g1_i1.p1 TRINITY_DN4975_c0_g1~~TRINITY_DN4975_c0_g1_i1.p1  ORF type:complete len:184 (-),score=8.51 TRINITY_DN4975_c0_g1_i1:76-585(-)